MFLVELHLDVVLEAVLLVVGFECLADKTKRNNRFINGGDFKLFQNYKKRVIRV